MSSPGLVSLYKYKYTNPWSNLTERLVSAMTAARARIHSIAAEFESHLMSDSSRKLLANSVYPLWTRLNLLYILGWCDKSNPFPGQALPPTVSRWMWSLLPSENLSRLCTRTPMYPCLWKLLPSGRQATSNVCSDTRRGIRASRRSLTAMGTHIVKRKYVCVTSFEMR